MINNRARDVDDSDDDDDALFVKDGVPVKFCFHKSVTQGRGRITRDVERYGGQVVAGERTANVLLVDEQEDLAFIRRRYYSSTELYRLSLYVEPRGFVQACIRAGAYRHVKPVKQGMPGRVPGGGGRVRVPFTEEDRDHLAYYLATRCPTRDGRMGVNAYKDLERLGQTDDQSWAWTRRHTFHSWREHYKMHPELMDPRIDFYIQRLQDIGHHYGHDPRSHDHRNLRRELAEEEEEESEDEEEWRGIGRRQEPVCPAGAAPRRPEQGARHEQDLANFDDEVEDDDDEVIIVEPPHVKRHRLHPDEHRQHDSRETQAKKARVSDVSPIERRTSGVEAGRCESSPARDGDTDMEESQELEGSDLFGDRACEEESRLHFDDRGEFNPMPFSPRTSPVPGQDVPPPSTQATLIASPLPAEKQLAPAPHVSTETAEAPAPPPPPTIPPSSQQTLVTTQERVVVQRARVRGASAQPGPSVRRERRTQGGAVAVDVPDQNNGAWPRPVEPQVQALRQREEWGDRRKGIRMEDVLIEEVVAVEEEQSEKAVEGLLQATTGIEADEDGDSSVGDTSELPRYQEIDVKSEPLESDDAETHGSLVRGAVREGSTGEGDVEGESGSEKHEDEDDADRVERMASGKLQAARAPQSRVTRSQTRARTEFSPRRTRSGNHARAAPSLFPSPGTKARGVVDRPGEGGSRPYVPPPGSRVARVVRGKGRRG